MTRSSRFLYAVILIFSSGIDAMTDAGNKTEEYLWLLLLDKPNEPPVIDPEIAIEFNWPADSAHLDASVTDDPNDPLVYEWTQLSGPGVVTFKNRFAEDTTATFPVYGETYVLQLSVNDGEYTPEPVQITVTFNFLENYTNPEQIKVSADGLYPFGQRMWLSMYSNSKSQLGKMKNAGMTLSGPHYSGHSGPDDLVEASNAGMKSYWRLRLSGSENWGTVTARMKTSEGRKWLSDQIMQHLNTVQSDSVKNNAIVAWYAQPEEAIHREGKSYTLAEQRAYLCFVRDIIEANDKKKRPYFMSERGDVEASTMSDNTACTSGVMKQNYLIGMNEYDYDGQELNERFLIGQWARDELNAAHVNDKKGLSYTGKTRPVIATLETFRDPKDTTLRNETWLRKAITHDFYLSIAMGVHGVNVYTWGNSSLYPQKTKDIQENLYLESIGKFANADLGKVFLWGDKRTDVDMQVTSGPQTFTWNKYSTTYTEPSIKFRNIQYGSSRYILLVNSSKEVIESKLSGFPKGLRILDVISGKQNDLGSSVTPTIQPLGVRMYKIEQK